MGENDSAALPRVQPNCNIPERPPIARGGENKGGVKSFSSFLLYMQRTRFFAEEVSPHCGGLWLSFLTGGGAAVACGVLQWNRTKKRSIAPITKIPPTNGSTRPEKMMKTSLRPWSQGEKEKTSQDQEV